MSLDNLYLVSSQWAGIQPLAGEATPAPITIPGQSATYNGAETTIVRIVLNGGDLTVAAQADIAGALLDQFSLDEAGGNLRLVTTWTDTADDAWTQTPALWILDPSLAVIGSIPALTTNESVQSVRFDQDVAYVVTYRQVDPLFTIDLSDPTAPVVRSALKIPGFSAYLHPIGQGLLLGIGVDADTSGKVTGGLKLSMFDVSDPYDVQETAHITFAGDQSEVFTDHKAAFVEVDSPDLALIGFPVTAWHYPPSGQPSVDWTYDLYSWDGSGFTQVKQLDLIGAGLGTSQLTSTDPTTRGLRVGQDFYVVTSAAVGVYDMTAYAQLAVVALA